MADWATPKYTKSRVDWAGEALITLGAPASYGEWEQTHEEYERALEIINNWRSSHSFPLNTFQMGLRRNAEEIDPEALVAQRIKRLSSISLKLRRFKTMKLSQMQDIGGCRAVVRSVTHLDDLVSRYKEGLALKHDLDHEDDYVKKPQKSGY